MVVLNIILTIIYIIVCLILIILTLLQTKEDPGLSSTITGSSTSNFFENNKGRTKEGRMKKWTVILAILWAILSIGLSIIYIAK